MASPERPAIGHLSEHHPGGRHQLLKGQRTPTNSAGKASSEIITRFNIPAKITARHPRQP